MIRFNIKFLYVVIISLLLLASGCSNNNQSLEADGKIKIYTTLSVLEEFTNRIGGDNVITSNIVPPGANAHQFEPTAKDISALMNADIFLYNGAGMEGWLKKVLSNLEGKNVELVNVSKDIKLRLAEGGHDHDHEEDETHGEDEDEENVDAHVWLNPLFALKQAEEIKNVLIQIDPSNQSYYESNFQELKEDLIDLDSKYKKELEATDRNDFFVSHAAFGYLAERYGLVQHSISGYVPSDEPSPAEMTKLIRNARELEIKYILVDPMDVTKLSRVLAEEIDAETLSIRTLANISNDDKREGLGYFTGMEKNLEVLKKALNE